MISPKILMPLPSSPPVANVPLPEMTLRAEAVVPPIVLPEER